jgi:hypothetical protein
MDQKQKLIILEGQRIHLGSSENPAVIFQIAKKNGIDVEIIEDIYIQKREFLLQKFNEGTDFYFQSTFHYEGNIAGLARMFAEIKESKNFYICTGDQNKTSEKILQVLSHDAELAIRIKHHNFYSVGNLYSSDIEEKESKLIKDLFRKITPLADVANKAKFVEEKIAKEAEIKNEKWRTAKLNPTGRKIKIGKVVAFNPAFNTLKEGDIVDELDPILVADPTDRPRGVWVWGDGQPVKLLSEGEFDEFEYYSGMTPNGILEELHKWSWTGHPNPQFKFRTETFLNDESGEAEEVEVPIMKKDADPFRYEKALKVLEDKKASSHERATELLDMFDLPRRGLREKLSKMVNLCDHTYFKPRALTTGRKTIYLGF